MVLLLRVCGVVSVVYSVDAVLLAWCKVLVTLRATSSTRTEHRKAIINKLCLPGSLAKLLV
jgi:hypothetical protein